MGIEGESQDNHRSPGTIFTLANSAIGWVWKLLTDHGPEPRRAINVIGWWEIRRPLYNLIVLAGGSLTILLWALTIKSWISMLPPPLFVFFGVIFLFVGANVCYTGGWIVELLVRRWFDRSSPLVTKFAKRAFVIGVLLSFGLTALPGLNSLFFFMIGHPVTTPLSNSTSGRPSETALVGRYPATEASLTRMEQAGLDPDQPHYIDLHADGTFDLVNFPDKLESYRTDGPRLYNFGGDWSVTEEHFLSDHTWYVSIADTFTSLEQLGPDNCMCGWRFNLRNDSPPYELLLWIGDPDLWDYLVFRQEEPRQTHP